MDCILNVFRKKNQRKYEELSEDVLRGKQMKFFNILNIYREKSWDAQRFF